MNREPMNIVEINDTIKDELKNIRNNDDLRELQKWAKKAKKQVVVKPTVTSFTQMYYTWYSKIRSHGSGRTCGEKLNKVQYTSFTFLGIEIMLPERTGGYEFTDELFSSSKIWVDRKIKYGGTSYFPKQPIDEMFGIYFSKMFFEHMEEKQFFIAEKWNGKGYALCDCELNAKKFIQGRRLTRFDLCNHPLVKIPKEYLDYLKLPIKNWESMIQRKNNSETNSPF